ncbi:MAG: efflux RND transporter permease subunit [Candidatus Riflebacteria bacterium]|nr:efflux RND transporter permease subunit [Candidatus Riflebacteria bacterium]
MDLPRFSVEKPVTVLMITAALVLAGLVAFTTFSIDLLPNIDFPLAFIQSPYPGVDPAEMENIVTRKIEEEVNTVENIKKLTSYSFEGFSWIMVEFNWGTKIDLASIDLREKVDVAKRKLPRDMEQITVAKLDINAQPVLNISLGGSIDLKTLRRIADKEIKPAFERLPGVANVEVFGGLEREIRVKVFPDRLKAYGFTINDVIAAISSDNMNTPVGNITEGSFKYLLRSEGEVKSPTQLGGINVRTVNGRPVYLSELARIEDSFKEIESVSRLNLAPAVSMQIKKEPGANPVTISKAAKKLLPKLEAQYQGKIQLTIAKDESEFIADSIAMVKENALLGSILTVIVIFLFLKNVRSTIVIGLSIPLAIIMTFAFMYLWGGLTLNLLTLGGLALGVGMIVDNAIVVIENIYRHLSLTGGKDRVECSIKGANEVMLAISATTFTHCAVFLPIGFVPGFVGQMFFSMSLAIVFSMLASLLVAVIMVPMLSAYTLRITREPSEPLMHLIRTVYRGILGWILRSRIRRWIYITGLMFVCYKSLSYAPPMEFFPKMDRGAFVLKFEAPEGTAVEKIDDIAAAMEKILKGIPEVKKIITDLKLGEGSLSVVLSPKETRTRTTNQIIQTIRPLIATIPGYRTVTFGEAKMGGSNDGKPVQIEVSGDDFSVIENICLDVAGRIKNVKGLKDLDSGVKKGRPEIKVEFDRARMGDMGLEMGRFAGTVRAYVYGQIAGLYKENNEEYDIRVEADDIYKNRIDAFRKLEVAVDGGRTVTMSQLGRVYEGFGYTRIERKNMKRLIKVQADVEGRAMQEVITDIKAIIKDMKLPVGYEIGFGGEQEEMTESFGYLALALVASILLVYMIMAAQFESFSYPFTIMFTIPLSIIGVILFLRIFGFAFSITAMIGIIMLAGIVVSNGIILVDNIIVRRTTEGSDRITAALDSGAVRLRPILMTALCTVLGLLPLALGIGAGSDFYQPLAITVMGGMTCSTILTLTYIPVVFVSVDEIVEFLMRVMKNIL